MTLTKSSALPQQSWANDHSASLVGIIDIDVIELFITDNAVSGYARFMDIVVEHNEAN